MYGLNSVLVKVRVRNRSIIIGVRKNVWMRHKTVTKVN